MELCNEDKGGMAQEQVRRKVAIKYGDVFDMSGELADKPISPRDAAAMKSAENRAFGKTVRGGPAELMDSAASKNLQAGLVGPDDDSGAVPAAAAHQTGAEGNLSTDGDTVDTGHLHGDPNRSTTSEGADRSTTSEGAAAASAANEP